MTCPRGLCGRKAGGDSECGRWVALRASVGVEHQGARALTAVNPLGAQMGMPAELRNSAPTFVPPMMTDQNRCAATSLRRAPASPHAALAHATGTLRLSSAGLGAARNQGGGWQVSAGSGTWA
eukprot:2354429-Rhodomonas_salina.1